LWGCHFVQSTRNRTMTSLRDEWDFFLLALQSQEASFCGSRATWQRDTKPSSCPSHLCDRMEPLKHSQSCGSQPYGNQPSMIIFKSASVSAAETLIKELWTVHATMDA
jgi:hypothetical protein